MKKAVVCHDVCPFYSRRDSICLASISSMSVSDINVLLRCQSEDHDNCPVFLSKILRNT